MNPEFQNKLLKQLEYSEKMISIFQNTKKEGVIVNRIKKFLKSPNKYIYNNAYKLGLIKNKDRHIKTFWGNDFFIPIDDANAIDIFYCGSLRFTESGLTRFLIKNLKEGDVFYDIGANYGYYSNLAINLVGDTGEVHAFEPNPITLKYTRENVTKTNKKTKIFINEFALSNTTGTASFFDTSIAHKSGMSTIITTVAQNNLLKYHEIKIKTSTFDEYIKNHNTPTVIKIDVEGSESMVLAGAKHFLNNFSSIIAMEVLETPFVISRTKQALELLKNAGYQSYEILSNGEIKQKEIKLGSVGENNIIIFKK